MLNDTLSNALSKILNTEKSGRKECLLSPASSELKRVLTILNEEGYLGAFEEVTPAKGGVLKVHLLNTINHCQSIKPRFSTRVNELEKFEKRFLPAKNMGILLITTPKGVMTHTEAKKQRTGGKLVAYCY